jgi:large subunit ribosomal protein L9e
MKIEMKKVNKHSAVRVEKWFGTKADMAAVRTIITHLRNMMIGVTKGFLYKMKLVNNHFPISVNQEGNALEIRNFIGEKRIRNVVIPNGVTFEKPKGSKDEIVFMGNDVDVVGQVCADIHAVTLVKNKDIRKFLDGIYVCYKGNVVEED